MRVAPDAGKDLAPRAVTSAMGTVVTQEEGQGTKASRIGRSTPKCGIQGDEYTRSPPSAPNAIKDA